ncbi:glycosyl hydrolase family 65, N-terminal domain-containing protein [Parachaetomium inaequale]|uniref:Glycosyl hydrolase family 65, N-terminal domain-containing protein n=1 Tax=Parachaetomium inaequale TaxID=2588326 RepID=A0AAN6P652_9PEZI|nr:glycosyl hydrolase family 65, N-terminal domain-containing protein [Parachaetomium inaequale]
MPRLFSVSAALLTAARFFTAVEAELRQPNSSSNPWRIWDDLAGGSGTFSEYYPIGNGRLGIMMSGDPRQDLIRLNENSFWSGGLLHRVNPDGWTTVKTMQQLILARKYAEAEDLGLQGYTGTPLSTRHYDKLGQLKLTQMLPDGQVTNYERWLGIDDAIAGAYFTVGNVTYQREYLVSYPDDVVAIHLTASKPGSINIRVRIDRGADLNRFQGWSEPANGHSTVTGGQSADGDPLQWAAGARIAASGGNVTTLGDTVRCEGADEATVYFQAWTSYRKPDPKRAVVSDLAAVSKSFDKIRAAHVADYQKYAGRVSISLGASTASQKALKTSTRMTSITPSKFDPELAALFFQLGRYLLIATSRPESGHPDLSLPPNLQGIWNDVYTPMWGSKYTVNINLQMNYWPSLVTGLSDLVIPLNNLLKTMGKEGAKVAAAMYRSTGTVTHHNTDMWGDSAPQDNYSPATFWAMGATWMITHVIEHYRFTGDTDMLRDMFPTLKAVAQFGLDFLTEHKGYMVTNPSLSPENTFVIPGGTNDQSAAVAAGPTIDNELLWEVFGFIPEAHAALGIKDKAFEKRVADMRARLPPLRLNQYGGIAEWMEDFEEANPGNGHMSHLVPAYPLPHITSANETLFKAAITSLQHRLDHGGGPCGWPRIWTIALAGRLFLPNTTHARLATQMGECSWNRTMLNMGGAAPFQIDGSLGAPGAVVEALLQSHESVVPAVGNGSTPSSSLRAAYTGDEGRVPLVRLLPSLPVEWAVNGGGFVRGLRARGGFVVDLAWDIAGRLTTASLTSEAGNAAYVTLGQARVGGGDEGTAIQANGGASGVFIRLEGKKGTVYKITVTGQK